MKHGSVAAAAWTVVALLGLLSGVVHGERVNPIAKVVKMLDTLHKKVVVEGQESQRLFNEFSGWCRDRSKELEFEIKTSEAQVANLKATLEKAADDIESLGTKIEELSAAISSAEGDLKAATAIRNKEQRQFEKEQKELVGTIDSMKRAIGILRKEMAKSKGKASLMQLTGAPGLVEAFTVLVEGSMLDSADTERLTALIQSHDGPGDADAEGADGSDDGDAQSVGDDGEGEEGGASGAEAGSFVDITAAAQQAFGAPDPASYEGKSGTIVDTIQGLLDKAQTQLEVSRQAEQSRVHNFELLKQSLEDKIRAANQNMDEAKKALGGAGEKKATAEGALSVTLKDLKEDQKALEDLHKECVSRASSFEEEKKTRTKELEALSAAKRVITEATGGAEKQAYKSLAQESFVQVSSVHNTQRRAMNAVHIVRKLAYSRNSQLLLQLSDQLDSVISSGAVSGDPFGKVKTLIGNMIAKLQKEAESESMHKAYCDKEMGETATKKNDKDAAVEKLRTKLDQMSADVAKLEEEVAVLQKELAELIKSQAEMDRIRQEQHKLFLKNKPELEEGINGIQTAMKILRDYYAKGDDDSGSGSGAGGIIGLLEVAESDFSMRLSELVETEQSSAAAYTKQTQDNRVTKAEKEADVTFKTKSSKALEKTIAELSTDKDGVQTELDAVNQYLEKLKEQCVAKPEPFEVRAQRRQEEMNSLEEAMRVLSGGVSFLQEKAVTLRSVRAHHL